MLIEITKKILPVKIKNYIKKKRQEKLKTLILSLPIISEENFRNVIVNKLGIIKGDIILFIVQLTD